MKETIIFDFNGTLIDDCNLCLDILNILTKENNLAFVSKRKYKAVFDFPVQRYYERCGFDVSNENFSKISARFHQFYNQRSYSEVKAFKSAYSVLEHLKDKYQLVCLSASKQETLEKQLKYYNLYKYFDDVVGLDNIHAYSKMQVAIDYATKNNLLDKKTYFIGDSIHDFEVASAINAKCILISTGHTAKNRLKKVNDIVIDDLNELLNYLD